MSRYLLPPILNTTRSFARISALRNIAFTSVGRDQSAALTTLTQVRNGCSASERPGRLQNSRKALPELIRNRQARLHQPRIVLKLGALTACQRPRIPARIGVPAPI